MIRFIKQYHPFKRKHWKKWAVVLTPMAIAYYFCLPDVLFDVPTSTIVRSRDGQLLAGRIASDGQWRFPASDSVPVKFEKALLCFEDAYFYSHPGVNPISLVNAARQNYNAGRVVRGGSTITMQVIRMAAGNPSRTVGRKLLEMVQATRLELRCSKAEILGLYAANAPFGGNVVGLEAAAWRYFGRSPHQLSWGEAATLAVLPNAPALIYPGKNQERLLEKRNRLLEKLHEEGTIDCTTKDLAMTEPLPQAPHALPQAAPHLLSRLAGEGMAGNQVVTTIHTDWQHRANSIVHKYHQMLSQNNVHNVAIMVLDVRTGEVPVYVGNSDCNHDESGVHVDVIRAPRSTGSILKPLLYAYALEDGVILPDALLADIPTRIAGYAPKNFKRDYDGAVPASNALTRSLNVPAVRLLREFGLERFHSRLGEIGLTTINKPASHYGLSLILGGGEATLWDLCSVYAESARKLAAKPNALPPAHLVVSDSVLESVTATLPLPEEGALWHMMETLANVNRPRAEASWERFASSRKVAWKTGTSRGHRDAWAIGITPAYVVGVWVGNADGEGRAGLTGGMVAGPVLFETFAMLPPTGWFEKPEMHLEPTAVCMQSGFKAGMNCPDTIVQHVPPRGLLSDPCPYHRLVHLDAERRHQVNSACYPVADMQHESWFVLPPIQEWFYKKKSPSYQSLPPVSEECAANATGSLAVIYPENKARLFVPRSLDGTMGRTVFEAAHRSPQSTIHWHLDDEYLGATQGIHRIEALPAAGWHKLTLVDEQGDEVAIDFEAVASL